MAAASAVASGFEDGFLGGISAELALGDAFGEARASFIFDGVEELEVRGLDRAGDLGGK